MFAEIDKITVTWNNAACTVKCGELIEKNLSEIKELDHANVTPSTGSANLKWKPGAHFSYTPIKVAMQMVGVGVNEVRMRVRGVVKEEGKDVVLYSLGDNTRFLIVSPLRPELTQPIISPHPSLRELSPQLRNRILPDAKQGKIMVIEGPLYKPVRSPPLMIVVERIQIEKKQVP